MHEAVQPVVDEGGGRFDGIDRFFFSSRRRHTRWTGDWSSDVRSSDLTSHEYLFLLSKGPRYYFDWRAIAEPTRDRTRNERRPSHGRNSRMTVSRDQRHLFEKKNQKVDRKSVV